MRSLQDIFNHMIDGGFYTEEFNESGRGDPYMCNALERAHDEGEISRDERDFALNEIDSFINPDNDEEKRTLRSALYENAMRCGYEDKCKIYRNWDKRPVLLFIEDEEENQP